MNPRAPGMFLYKILSVTAIMLTAVGQAAEPDKDPQMGQRIADAEKLVQTKKPQAAIAKCDSVINAFNAEYGKYKERVYCATSSAESLGYLLEAVVKNNDSQADKRNAIVLSSIWSNAYFLKGYALQDLGRIGDASVALTNALHLSPYNPHYLCEMGTIYQLEKDWNKALKTFKDAEDHNPLAPEETRADDLGRARRGTAYVLVELGKLDEAEKKYRQCLKTDPHDTRATRELEYLHQQKQKRGSH